MTNHYSCYLHFKERIRERYSIRNFHEQEYREACKNKFFAVVYTQEKSKMILLDIQGKLVCAIKSNKGHLITALPIERAIKAVRLSNPRNRKFYASHKTTDNPRTGDNEPIAAL